MDGLLALLRGTVGLALRRRTNNKKYSAIERKPYVLGLLWKIRRLKKSARSDQSPSDLVHGRFTPRQTWNVDQVPLDEDEKDTRTYEQKGASDVYVKSANPSNSGVSRFGTMQVLVRAENPQPQKIAVIFFGKGQRIKNQEKRAYHKNVDVYFQPRAWADGDFCIKWALKTFKNEVSRADVAGGQHILWMDNLSSQKDDKFIKVL